MDRKQACQMHCCQMWVRIARKLIDAEQARHLSILMDADNMKGSDVRDRVCFGERKSDVRVHIENVFEFENITYIGTL